MCARIALQLTLVALATLVLPTAPGAQTGLATVTGIVSDVSGATVPGLIVTATNQATNIGYTGVTNEAGNYIITGVPIGTFVIATELQGFKSVQSTVTLSAGQTVRVDCQTGAGGTRRALSLVAPDRANEYPTPSRSSGLTTRRATDAGIRGPVGAVRQQRLDRQRGSGNSHDSRTTRGDSS